MVSYRRPLAGLLLALLLTGCVTGTAETTVGDDGMLEAREILVDIDPIVYEVLDDEATRAGYDGLEDRMIREANRTWAEVEYTEEVSDDHIRIHLRTVNGDPAATTDIDIEVRDEEILYIDNEGPGVDRDIPEAYHDLVDLTWVVHMPGEIIQSNGEISADNRSVTWTFAEHGHLDTFAVSSERPGGAEGNDTVGWLLIALGFLAIGGLAVTLTVREIRRD